jgi:hypothetical protein
MIIPFLKTCERMENSPLNSSPEAIAPVQILSYYLLYIQMKKLVLEEAS